MDYGIREYSNKNDLDINKVGRVIVKYGHYYDIYLNNNIYRKVMAVNQISSDQVFVGDFVHVVNLDDEHYIVEVLKRSNVVSKEASTTMKSYHDKSKEQILATNVDNVFILIAADQKFTIGKLERYILTFKKKDIHLNIVIIKADYKDKTESIRKEINKFYPELNIFLLSNFNADNIEDFKQLIQKNSISILLGASGVGKSTLFNNLFSQDKQHTQSVRTDGKGKHTTTHTQMLYNYLLNAYIIDTPGFKTINAVHSVDESILFSDIVKLSKHCKFRDCTHSHEPGCAVKKAINEGDISEDYYERYLENKRIIDGQIRHQKQKDRKHK